MTQTAVPTGRFTIPIQTEETRSEWLNAARRMQSVAQSRGASIITLRVLVDAHGEPMLWLEPQVVRVEPAGRSEETLRLFLGIKD